jgi:hypothetical protein
LRHNTAGKLRTKWERANVELDAAGASTASTSVSGTTPKDDGTRMVFALTVNLKPANDDEDDDDFEGSATAIDLDEACEKLQAKLAIIVDGTILARGIEAQKLVVKELEDAEASKNELFAAINELYALKTVLRENNTYISDTIHVNTNPKIPTALEDWDWLSDELFDEWEYEWKFSIAGPSMASETKQVVASRHAKRVGVHTLQVLFELGSLIKADKLAVRCAFFDRNSHSRMLFSWVSTPRTGSHCKLRKKH